MTRGELIALLPLLPVLTKAALTDALDDMVHTEKAREAAGLNNEGPEAQLRYLYGADTDQVAAAVAATLEED